MFLIEDKYCVSPGLIAKNIVCCLVFVFPFVLLLGREPQTLDNTSTTWKVGIARENITPHSSLWMAGYASRTSPSDGIIHDLWAKAICLEDSQGCRSLLITTDLLSIPQDFSNELRDVLKEKYGLEKSHIILSCSHTHSGPVIARALEYVYPMDDIEWRKVYSYTKYLKERILLLVANAIEDVRPAKISTKNGISRFQVNRRTNREYRLEATTPLNGPNDYAVPVIKVEGLDHKIIAVIFGYACHPTTLSIDQFSGDYPGFAQIEIEKMYPGTMAMFFQGAGADQNPVPRKSIPLAIQYGKQLAASVECVLSADMDMQQSVLTAHYSEIDLPLDKPIPIEEMRALSLQDNYEGRWAKGMISEYEQMNPFITEYSFPLQYWNIGNQQLFVLGGEAVISYSLLLKQLFGNDIFVISYANDVMGYIPTADIIDEGGYEGDTSQRAYGLPAKWDKQIESLILTGFRQMVK